VPSWYGDTDAAIAALEEEGVEVSRIDPLLPRTLVVGNPATAIAGELVSARRLFTIDAAAQLTVRLCDARAQETIVEIGSGRGTKTLLLASEARLSGSAAARVIGVDSFEYKSMITLEQALSYDLSEVSVQTVDARDADALIEAVGGSGVADTVLIDAPCSGIGTLRRHVDKRWRLSESDIADLAGISMELLVAASHAVKAKGKIIFATCTMAEEENAEVVRRFLESPEGGLFEIEQIQLSEVPESWGDFITEEGFFQSIPLDGGPDGHFIARMRKG
jgi:16S rRNA (cytosine967-C5)-methyltransferase